LYKGVKSEALRTYLLVGDCMADLDGYTEARRLSLHGIANELASKVAAASYTDWDNVMKQVGKLGDHLREDQLVGELRTRDQSMLFHKKRKAIAEAKREESEPLPSISTTSARLYSMRSKRGRWTRPMRAHFATC